MAIKARFYVAKFDKQVIGRVSQEDPTPVLQALVTLNAVTRKDTRDNVDWAKYSPSGTITLMVSQQAGGAFEAFEALLGKDVSLTFEEIPDGQ